MIDKTENNVNAVEEELRRFGETFERITNCNQSCLWDSFRPSKIFLEILKKVIDM